MPDNTVLKDAIGNNFTLRAKDLAQGQDGSIRRSMTLATLFPVDYGVGGSYQLAGTSGVMAAGMAGGSTIFSFRLQSSALLALVRKVKISAWSSGIGFTAGLASFGLYSARPFTAGLSGATTLQPGGRMRGDMALGNALLDIAISAALTGGTFTAGPAPVAATTIGVGTAAYTLLTPQPILLLDKDQGEMPFVCARDEGFLLRATVPSTGTWGFAVTTEWDEVPLYSAGF